MKGSKDLLSSVLKTTQMGQIGIRSVLKNPVNASLRKALNSQLQEYDTIEQEAHAIASSRGWTLEELDPSIRLMTNMMTRACLKFGDTDSKAASMMMRGNMRGVIKGYRNLHQFNHSDERVSVLMQKLIDCEESNIHQMQGYL